jgi:hypothetical protein
MRDALLPLIAGRDVELIELDVDADDALESRFGELVPVLLLGDVATGRELCHYHLDAEAVRRALATSLIQSRGSPTFPLKFNVFLRRALAPRTARPRGSAGCAAQQYK